jgi:hypothetical protein
VPPFDQHDITILIKHMQEKSIGGGKIFCLPGPPCFGLETSDCASKPRLAYSVSSDDMRLCPHGSATLSAYFSFVHRYPLPARESAGRFGCKVSACGLGPVCYNADVAHKLRSTRFEVSATLTVRTCRGLCFFTPFKRAKASE